MGDRIEQLWCMASALRAEVGDSRLGLRLEELMCELEVYFADEEVASPT